MDHDVTNDNEIKAMVRDFTDRMAAKGLDIRPWPCVMLERGDVGHVYPLDLSGTDALADCLAIIEAAISLVVESGPC